MECRGMVSRSFVARASSPVFVVCEQHRGTMAGARGGQQIELDANRRTGQEDSECYHREAEERVSKNRSFGVRDEFICRRSLRPFIGRASRRWHPAAQYPTFVESRTTGSRPFDKCASNSAKRD